MDSGVMYFQPALQLTARAFCILSDIFRVFFFFPSMTGLGLTRFVWGRGLDSCSVPTTTRIPEDYCRALINTFACNDALTYVQPHTPDVSLTISCGSAASDAAVTAFAKGCRRLRRLNLRGVVGVPPPLGAHGLLAVCSHCCELELLDIGEVRDLEDSALASFQDHQMEKLERVSWEGR